MSSLPQDKNDYIDGSIIGISGIRIIDDDENNNSNHVAHTESNINNSAFIATDDYYSTSSSDESERNKSIEVSVVFASEDYNSKNKDDSIILKSSPTVAKKKKKKKKLSSNANKDTERVNPSSVKPKDNEEEEEQGVGCNNKEVAVLVLPPNNKNAVDFNINTNNGSSSTIIGKSNNDILGIAHFSDSISEEGRDDNGGRNKNVAEQPVLYNNEDDGSSSTFSSKPYPADTYSLLSLHGPVGNPVFFSYGLMVYLFQMTFLVLMVLSVVHEDWSSNGDVDNPDAGRGSLLERLAEFVPSHVSPLVRATQITATLSYIIFADSTMLDVVTAVELFPNFKQATSDNKLGCMVFASILRLSQGIFAITVTLLLIVTSSTTIEIILNFTAINFISTLDNVGFELIKWGKYGPKFEEEAKRIEKLPLPRCLYRKYKHVRYLCTIIPIGVILFSMICSMIILQESNNHWVTKIFCVQFQDKEQGLQVYNGCYEKNETAINRYKGFRRKLYEGVGNNAESAKFGYCIDDRRWILFNGDNANACEAGVLARSSKTDTFDVSTMFDETWYSNMNIPLDLFFCEFYDVRENQCVLPDNGICNLELNSIDFRYDGGDCCAVFSYHFYTSHMLSPNALGYNDITSSIPSEIGLITSLDYLDLSENDLTGTIPSEMGLLTSLEILDLSVNAITGSIPSEIGLMTSLTSLHLAGNDLTGTIPREIGLMTSLEYLYLGENDLTGTIPSEMGLMTSLKYPDLSYNDLTGTIPSKIRNMTSLIGLSFGYNDLTGTIPSEIGLLTSLEYLDLNNNALTSTIPIEIRLMTSLRYLDLDYNNLTGTIPSEIGLMTSLDYLFLYGNTFTGSVPSEIGLMTLEYLNLNYYAFTGSIPTPIPTP